MSEEADRRWHDLIALYQSEEISDIELAELEAGLRDSEQVRTLYHRACRIDMELLGLTEEDEDREQSSIGVVSRRRRISLLDTALAAAVIILVGILAGAWMSRPSIIATIVSSESAAWESALPTSPGSGLTAGDLRLKNGIATIRFRSGAEMMLEAPAFVSLKTPMRAFLESGAAILEVPESAIGFVLETPRGDAIDHGTSFAVNVRRGGAPSTFEVIEGEISVVAYDTGEEVRLRDQQGAHLSGEGLSIFEGPQPEEEFLVDPGILRLRTNGRSYSVIRADKEKWLHPELLAVRSRKQPTRHERRSFFAFDLSSVELDEIESARIRLNQVPSGIGFAARLSKVTSVAVYGMTNREKAGWQVGTTWEEGPSADDGIFLGTIEIPRSEQRSNRVFADERLIDFLRSNRGGQVTFILDREIDPVSGTVPSLLIAFASDLHPEAVGPILELIPKKEPKATQSHSDSQ